MQIGCRYFSNMSGRKARIDEWREKKLEKVRERNKLAYQRKKEEVKASQRRRYQERKSSDSQSRTRSTRWSTSKTSTSRVAKHREKQKKKTEAETLRKQKYRKAKSEQPKSKDTGSKKTDEGSLSKTVTVTTRDGSSSGSKIRMKRLRSLKEVKAMLPKSTPEKVELIKKLVSTPKTKASLQNEGILTSDEVQENYESFKAVMEDTAEMLGAVKSKRSKSALAIKRTVVAASCSGPRLSESRRSSKVARKLFAVRSVRQVKKARIRDTIIEGKDALVKDAYRKSRGLKLNSVIQNQVATLWAEEASRPTTDTTRGEVRKRIARNTYLSHTRHIATMTLREALSEYRRKYTNDPHLSESSFWRLKPFFVRQATQRDLEQCCCQMCTATKKCFRALMNYRRQQKSKELFDDLYAMVAKTLCPKPEGDSYKSACLKRECSQCGIKMLHFTTKELNESDDKVIWYNFEYITLPSGQRKMDYVKKETCPQKLVEKFVEYLGVYPWHTFTAKWQREQWCTLIENLPQDHAALEMDFSENFSCLIQEEIQSLHWSTKQVAIHSVVIWRPALKQDKVDYDHVKEHWLIVSDDLKHDYHFVHNNITLLIIPELKKLGCNITVLHERTDGCASQYKSCHAFGDISRSEAEINVHVIRNFSASGHGKGEVDAAAGALKTAARKAIVSGGPDKFVCQSASDLYNFALSHFQTTGKKAKLHDRRFFLLDQGSVDRTLRGTYTTVKGTKKLHQICSCGINGVINVRELSCYCFSCLQGNYSECCNQDIVSTMLKESFSPDAPCTVSAPSKKATVAGTCSSEGTVLSNEEEHDITDSVNMHELVTEDSIVAVRPVKVGLYDFFLFKVTSEKLDILAEDEEDEFGSCFPKGSQVFKGNYFDFQREMKAGSMYKLNKKQAFVYSDSVVFVGVELVAKRNQFFLTNDIHQDIISVLF